MKKTSIILALVSSIVVVACGGGGGGAGGGAPVFTSTVTGVVYDQFLQPIIGASVTAGRGSTTTSTSGAFVLTGQSDDYVEVVATLKKNGVNWRGSSITFNSPSTQSTSVGIVMAPVSELARVTGIVTDNSGTPLQDAAVFAYSSSGGTSKRTATDSSGEFEMADLVAGVIYKFSATGQTYRSDQVSLTLSPGQNHVENFTLGNAGVPLLNAPTNLSAITYTSYPTAAKMSGLQDNLDWVKKHFAKKSKSNKVQIAVSRAIRPDIRVEAQLDWLYSATTETQGYGIYRSNGSVANPSGYDFYYDPLATTYFDSGLEPSSTYTYGVTATSSFYPDDPNNTQSDLSDTTVVDTLGKLAIGSYTAATKKFTWSGGSGATDYIVYLFDEFPNADRVVFASNESSPVSTTSWTYSGPSLVAGHTYYWFVLGLANSDSSRTISQVRSFKA